jgi:hypothetical protein
METHGVVEIGISQVHDRGQMSVQGRLMGAACARIASAAHAALRCVFSKCYELRRAAPRGGASAPALAAAYLLAGVLLCAS